MADELEYHVTFPTKFSTQKRVGSCGATAEAATAIGDVELTERNAEKESVIFLLGWNGADDKDLDKFSAVYQSEGFVTIRYILPREYLFDGKLGEVNFIAVKVLEAFFDLGLEENPIFFHLFGNSGGYIYRAITDLLNSRDPGLFAALKVCGVIWDSAPYRPSFVSIIRDYCTFSSDGFSQPSYIAYLKMAPSWLWLVLKHVVFPSYWEANSLMNSYMEVISNDKMMCPQLFIYSKGDTIAWYRDIQNIVARRKKEGYDVSEVLLDNTDHLEHMARHHEEYVEACLDLVLRGVDHFDGDK